MFDGCPVLKYLNLANLKADKVTDMNYLFNGCSNLVILVFKNIYIDSYIIFEIY